MTLIPSKVVYSRKYGSKVTQHFSRCSSKILWNYINPSFVLYMNVGSSTIYTNKKEKSPAPSSWRVHSDTVLVHELRNRRNPTDHSISGQYIQCLGSKCFIGYSISMMSYHNHVCMIDDYWLCSVILGRHTVPYSLSLWRTTYVREMIGRSFFYLFI